MGFCRIHLEVVALAAKPYKSLYSSMTLPVGLPAHAVTLSGGAWTRMPCRCLHVHLASVTTAQLVITPDLRTSAVACLAVHPDQQRVALGRVWIAGQHMLQRRNELVAVEGHHAVIMVRCAHTTPALFKTLCSSTEEDWTHSVEGRAQSHSRHVWGQCHLW